MFATKKDIEEWCKSFLENKAGQFLCPFENEPVTIVKAKGGKYQVKMKIGCGMLKILSKGQYDEN